MMIEPGNSSIAVALNNPLPFVGPDYRGKHWRCHGCQDPGGHFADHPAPCPPWVPQELDSDRIYPMKKVSQDIALISEANVRLADMS
jgi:hypothetical protein